MALRNLLKRKLISCDVGTPIKRACELMEANNVGHHARSKTQGDIDRSGRRHSMRGPGFGHD
jgi:hypothetical protein